MGLTATIEMQQQEQKQKPNHLTAWDRIDRSRPKSRLPQTPNCYCHPARGGESPSPFSLHQAVVAALAGATFGLLDEQSVQQLGNGFVDELASVLGVDVEDDKGELLEDAFQQGHPSGLPDGRRG
jgi:hypothetical protein